MCGIFPMAQNVKNNKIGQNGAFFVEKHAVYTKFWKYIPILWSIYVFVSRPSTGKKERIFFYHQHPF